MSSTPLIDALQAFQKACADTMHKRAMYVGILPPMPIVVVPEAVFEALRDEATVQKYEHQGRAPGSQSVLLWIHGMRVIPA